jgi:hypothetical protein
MLSWLLGTPRVQSQPIITAPRPSSTNQPDPLAAFMVAQPPIDTASAIRPTVQFEPATIALGDESVYRVVLNVMEQAIDWPDSFPTPPGCVVRKGASGQFLQNVGGAIIPKTTFLYHVKPERIGTFTVPAQTIQARGETVTLPAATLNVVAQGAAPANATPRIALSTRGESFYVGQDIELQATLPGLSNGRIQTLSQVQILGDGLIVDRNFRSQRIETRIENGVSRATFVYNGLVTPVRPGRIVVTVQGHTIGNRIQGTLEIPGAPSPAGRQPTYTLVDSDPLTLTVLPLPREQELPGFTGGIGSFIVDTPAVSTNHVRAGDLITLRLTVRGIGNLHRILPPEVGQDARWQVYPPQRENLLSAVIRQRGFVTFEYQLIPLDDGITATPPIPFCTFNPESGRYVDLTPVRIPITVDPSPEAVSVSGHSSVVEARSLLREWLATPAEPTELAAPLPHPGKTSTSLKASHAQGWFWGLQVLPASLLGGLWFWDRRRRFYEQHPEVLLQRRAKRTIRREARRARRAARQGDAPAFLEHAICGFREACALATPADPRALVCGDILAALPQDLRTRQTVGLVEQLFGAANDWRFGEAPPDTAALLALARQVEDGLETLRRDL